MPNEEQFRSLHVAPFYLAIQLVTRWICRMQYVKLSPTVLFIKLINYIVQTITVHKNRISVVYYNILSCSICVDTYQIRILFSTI